MLLTGTIVVILALCFTPSQGATERLYFRVNGGNARRNSSTYHVTSNQEKFYLDCFFDSAYLHPQLYEINSSGTRTSLHATVSHGRQYIRYEIPSAKRSYEHLYSCSDDSKNYYVLITLDYGSSEFQGLNPLVYTISAVILLGTLAIVAIITCWIRARRSFGVGAARGNNTPQDYLNYINDEEFTPLTQSEFAASLDERPPSYFESEKLEQTAKQEQTASSADSAVEEPTSTATVSRVILQRRLPPLNPQPERGSRRTEITARESALPTADSQ